PVTCSTIQELSELVSHFERETCFETISNQLIKDLTATIATASKDLNVWDELEDYTIIQFISEKGYKDLPSSITFDDIARLVEGERNIKLSGQTLDQIKGSLYQYS